MITGRGTAIPNRPQSSRWIAPTESGSIGSRRNAAKVRSSSSGTWTGRPRTVARTATGSASSRRSMNVSTSAELASSHCASSSATSTGRSSASVRTTESSASPRTRVSGKAGLPAPGSAAQSREHAVAPAPAAAARCKTGGNRSPTAAKATCVSDWVGHDRSTRKSRSLRRAAPPARELSFRSRLRPPAATPARRPAQPPETTRAPAVRPACR